MSRGTCQDTRPDRTECSPASIERCAIGASEQHHARAKERWKLKRAERTKQLTTQRPKQAGSNAQSWARLAVNEPARRCPGTPPTRRPYATRRAGTRACPAGRSCTVGKSIRKQMGRASAEMAMRTLNQKSQSGWEFNADQGRPRSSRRIARAKSHRADRRGGARALFALSRAEIAPPGQTTPCSHRPMALNLDSHGGGTTRSGQPTRMQTTLPRQEQAGQ